MARTINDVAKEAGVSITTVSRVLNNNYPVKKETREKIEKAIEKLNYRPNTMARSLITKKTGVIGVVVPGLTNLFFPTVVEAIEEYIDKEGYSIMLCHSKGDSKRECEIIEGLLSKRVDGIIAIDPSYENLKSGYLGKVCATVPTILVNGSPEGFKGNFVSYDEKVGTLEAFDYLYELGHRKIAFIRGDNSFSYDLKENVYKEFLKDRNIDYLEIIKVGQANSLGVIDKSGDIIRDKIKESEPTAIFCCNDLIALSTMKVCSDLNLEIPRDISIIGFDNTLISNIMSPKLTTVDQGMVESGQRAAMELMDLFDKDIRRNKKIIIDTNLIIRESTGKVRNT
ncbi:LacI family DNA-binding transcriptional regulator [Clostridium hydrogeniformans]|uniref:LacI family DNA-binding transcriptional regulator n=1 Tax=Clostridium hydrogeniformans TaxID=349933 RepID=UPI0004890CD1|nr:LacI family DNA-binding transcriptional regulator [Clostridium hydrogeniformans]